MSNTGGITIPDFKVYYRAIMIKITWYWHKNRHEDQLIRTKDPDIKPHSYRHKIFNKEVQRTQWRKDNFLNKCCWENWISKCRKLNCI
jgi:hypothetical protein